MSSVAKRNPPPFRFKRTAEVLSIADRVVATRRSLQMERKDLAEKSGLSTTSVYMVERGEVTNPRPETMSKLAKALGVTVDFLRTGKSTKNT